MGEHRVDQLAARKRPVPRPLSEPVEVLTTPAPREPGGRKRVKQVPHRWRRRMSRMAKSKRGRWTLIGLACLVVLMIGLLAQGFLSSPAPAVSMPGAGDQGAALTPSASPSSSPAKHGGKGDNHLVTNPVQRLRNAFPDNPLNHLKAGQLHEVTVAASAPGRMAVVGYLVPTGLGSTYGSVNGRSHWSITEQALGGGYLAAIYLQTDKSGTPITCTVTVDGAVTSSQTTSGSYGRALCLG